MKGKKPKRGKSGGTPSGGMSLRRTPSGNAWALVHPRGVRDRAEDIAEVREMIAEGESEIAVDELRWLLSGCSEFIEAHALLGELALANDNDIPLARGHFGFAYQLGHQTLRRNKCRGPLPYDLPANQPFFHAGQGLAWCLEQLGKSDLAQEVVVALTALDPKDPLQLRAMLDEIRGGGLPVVDLLDAFPKP